MLSIYFFARGAVAVCASAHVGQHVDQCGDVGAERDLYIRKREVRVFNGVVKPGGSQHVLRVRHTSHDFDNRCRMNDVRRACGLASLADLLVALSCQITRPAYQAARSIPAHACIYSQRHSSCPDHLMR